MSHSPTGERVDLDSSALLSAYRPHLVAVLHLDYAQCCWRGKARHRPAAAS